ncbi:prepilin-type N-terminal cleavage/methylation domain-containing protein [Microcoleus sp. F8-D3]
MKTPLILLKLLHKSAAKPSPNCHKTSSKKDDGGFTLLEVLVIALIIGIFSSIAAPSWEAFINRQRVRTVNDRVLQTLRTAQSEAKRTKRDITVTFNPTDPPTVTINPTDPATNPPVQTALTTTPPIQTVTFDGGGEIKPGTIILSTNAPNAPSITFNYQGNITSPSIQSSTPRQITDGFTVTVAPFSGGAKQCVVVETLLGGMRTDEGEFKTGTGQGCP